MNISEFYVLWFSFLGRAEDCELIWQAKNLNMDTGCYIDTGLLCGAGYSETIDYLSDKPELKKMKSYISGCYAHGDVFEREMIIENFVTFYS